MNRCEKPVDEGSLRRRIDWAGMDALSEELLLALVLGPSSSRAKEQARELMENLGSPHRLTGWTPEGLCRATGLRRSQATRLLAAVELGRRAQVRSGLVPPTGPLTPARVAQWAVPQLGGLEHEEVWVLTVDAQTRLRSRILVGRGGAHGCALLPRDVLAPVVRAGAVGFVLVHNHPSGDPRPSPEDVDLTESVGRASRSIGAPLLDHVIVAGRDYRSLLDTGHLAA